MPSTWVRWYTSPVYGHGRPIITFHLPVSRKGRFSVRMACGRVAEGGVYPSDSAPRCKRSEEIERRKEAQ